MRVTINFEKAPPLTIWQEALTPSGWKITKYTDSEIYAKNMFGESKFPMRNSTTWNITIKTSKDLQEHKTVVHIDVPAFSESDYAENRMRKKIADIADSIDGDYKTDDDLSVDVLKRLRKYHESTK